MGDKSWNVSSGASSGDVQIADFNPEDFGFKAYIPKRGGWSRSVCDADYLIYTPGKDGKNGSMFLSMSTNTGEYVVEVLGRMVQVFINEKGQLLLCKGKTSTISHKDSKRASGRFIVSITGLADEVFDIHGRFRKLYLSSKPFNNGNAILFAPNGDKDRL